MAAHRAGVALAALVLAGFGLRPQLIAVGPLLPQITADLGVSHAVAGLLTTIPMVSMALVAIPAASVVHRFGSRRTVTVGLALVAGGGLARAVAPDATAVLSATVAIGIGIGIVGVVLPVFVKQWLPGMAATATGIYVTAMLVGSALAGTLAVPMAELGAGWRDPLLAFSLLGVVITAGWLLMTERDHASPAERQVRTPLPWRRGVVWLLVLLFCLQAFLFFGLATWLAPALVEQGWRATEAGALVGLLIVAGLPGTLLTSWAGDRIGSRRLNLILASGVSLAAVAGLVAVPGLGVLWAVAGGVGMGAVFALVMTLPLDAAGRPDQAGSLTAIMLAAGYLLAGVAPALLGAARDLTGSFTASMWLLVMAGALLLGASLLATPGRVRPQPGPAPTTHPATALGVECGPPDGTVDRIVGR